MLGDGRPRVALWLLHPLRPLDLLEEPHSARLPLAPPWTPHLPVFSWGNSETPVSPTHRLSRCSTVLSGCCVVWSHTPTSRLPPPSLSATSSPGPQLSSVQGKVFPRSPLLSEQPLLTRSYLNLRSR